MKKLFIAIALVLSLVVAPQLTKAATVQELQDMITVLMAKVEQLKAQLGQQQNQVVQTNTTTNAGCFDFNTNLKIGSRGQDVRNLQALLKEKGHLPESVEVTGYYGKATASALYKFQGSQNLSVSKEGQGVFGNMTRNKLNQLFGCLAQNTPKSNGVSGVNNQGQGENVLPLVTTATSTTPIVATLAAPSVAVISPNGGEKIVSGTNLPIKWKSSNIVDNYLVDLYAINKDTGKEYMITSRNEKAPLPQYETWEHFNFLSDVGGAKLPEGKYVIKVVIMTKSYKLIATDISDGTFEIVPSVSSASSGLIITSPSAGESIIQGSTGVNFPIIKWNAADITDAYLANLSIINESTGIEYSIGKNIASQGQSSYSFNYVQDLSGTAIPLGKYKVKIVAYAMDINGILSAFVSGISNGSFNLIGGNTSTSAAVSVIYPNGGETLLVGNTYPIKWTATGAQNAVISIGHYPSDESGDFITRNVDATSGSYNWTVPIDFFTTHSFWKTGDQYKIHISLDAGGYGAQDESDGSFTIKN